MSGRLDRATAIPALAAALLVLGVQALLQLLSMLLTALAFTSNAPGEYLVSVGLGYLSSVVFRWLPFAVGVFLTLWLLAPRVVDPLPWPVVLRSILAAAGGALVLFLVSLGAGLLGRVSASDGLVFGWGRAILGSVVSGFDSAFGYAIVSALGTAIAMLPLTMLAAVLVWFRQRTHPPAGASTGRDAEV